MADSLDAMLEPGERVLWRMPRVVLPRHALWMLSLLLPAFVIQVSTRGFDPITSLTTLVLLLILFGIFGALINPEDWSARALVTDRRLLHRARWRSPVLTDIPLAEIAALEIMWMGGLRIERRNGAGFAFDDPRRAQDLAVALAEAAGLPRPVVYGPLVNLEWFPPVWGITASVALVVWAIEPLADFIRGVDTVFEGLIALGLSLAWALAILAGVALGIALFEWITLAVLRPFLRAETVRAWLQRRADTEAGLLPHYVRVARKLTRRWAALLWGEAMNGPKEGANAHG